MVYLFDYPSNLKVEGCDSEIEITSADLGREPNGNCLMHKRTKIGGIEYLGRL